MKTNSRSYVHVHQNLENLVTISIGRVLSKEQKKIKVVCLLGGDAAIQDAHAIFKISTL
jgi:hypothetical protein